MSAQISIRSFQPEDAVVLLRLFQETVRLVNSRDYSPEQVHTWGEQVDPVAWGERFSGRYVAVAEQRGSPVGFCDLEENGHLDRFFVSAYHQRQGIGRLILLDIEQAARRRGIPRLFLEASLTARPFFEAQGYRVTTSQMVTLRGVPFQNFQMEKFLET